MANVHIDKKSYTVDSLYQWDINQELVIYGLSLATIPEIHYTNDAMDKAIVRQATMDNAGVIRAEIPNSLLQKPYKIRAYVCIYEGDTFKSLYLITIPVNARSMPTDYTITVSDDEVYSFNALENKLENTLALSLARYEEANQKYNEAANVLAETVVKTTAHKESAEASATNAANSAAVATGNANAAATSAAVAVENANSAISAKELAEESALLAVTNANNANAAKVGAETAANNAEQSKRDAENVKQEVFNYLELTKDEIVSELSKIEAPQVVPSLSDMTDTTKHYVFNENIWAYMLHDRIIPESNYNVFNYDTNNGSRINTRLSREGTESTTNGAKGSFITNYIELKNWNNYTSYNMYINFKLQSITLSATTAVFYDENKNVIGNVVGYETTNTDNITTTDTSSVFDLKRDAQQTGGVVNIPNAKYVRVQLFKKESGTALTTSDLAGVEIMLEANKTPASTVKEYGWTDTGISYAPTFKTDLIGVLAENNVIYLSDNALPSGTYTLKYGDETYDTIGTLTVV